MKIEDIKVGSILIRNGKDGRGVGIARDSKEGREYTVTDAKPTGNVQWRDDTNELCSIDVTAVAKYFTLKADVDLTKPVKTKDGVTVILKFVDGRGVYPVRGYKGDSETLSSWTATGQFNSVHAGSNDLVNVPEKITQEVFINVYRGKDGVFFGAAHESVVKAANSTTSTPIGRAKVVIDIEEGEFQ